MATLSRTDFLSGAFAGGASAPLRPPWALAEAAFREACTGCGDCRRACPERILVRGRGELPEVDFQRGGCTFCGACVSACPSGALVLSGASGAGAAPQELPRDLPQDRPWDLTAVIGEDCLSLAGVTCRICEERCSARAIRFRPQLGGRSAPRVEAAACTGCGDCLGACPAGAIEIQHARDVECAA